MNKLPLAKRAQVLTLLCEGVFDALDRADRRLLHQHGGQTVCAMPVRPRLPTMTALVRGVKSPAHPVRRDLELCARQGEERAEEHASRRSDHRRLLDLDGHRRRQQVAGQLHGRRGATPSSR